MARTGRFGRLPRTSGNLTSIIVGLAREMAAREDTNIVDAWKEGGEFHGKPVTDEMLLAFLDNRRKSLSPNDPLWDYYDNLHLTYDFSIAESKMTLKYAQHGVNETQMANFYTGWAKKMPVNSEVYRSLMRSAAQFVDAAKAKAGSGGGGGGGGGRRRSSGGGGGSRRGGSQDAYDAAFLGAYDRYEKGYDTAILILEEAARRADLITDTDDLEDLRVSDNENTRFVMVFEEIASRPEMSDLREALQQAGINPADFTYSSFMQMADDKAQGMRSRMQIAQSFGDDSEAEDIYEELTEFGTFRSIIGDVEPLTHYESARRDLDFRLSNPDMDPYTALRVYGQYQRTLQGLLPALEGDNAGLVRGELDALTGRRAALPRESGEYHTNEVDKPEEIFEDLNIINSMIQSVEQGQAVFTRLPPTAEGDPTWGVVPSSDVDRSQGTLYFQEMGSLNSRPIYSQWTPIRAYSGTAVDSRTGMPRTMQKATADNLLGYTYEANGVRYYGIYTGGGQMVWTTQNPFMAVTQPDGTLTKPTIGMSGNGSEMQVSWTLNVPPGAANAKVPDFDPLAVLDQRLLDPELASQMHRTQITDDPTSLMYMVDDDLRRGLLGARPDEVRALLANTAGGPEEAAALWEQWVNSRNSAAYVANTKWEQRADRFDARGGAEEFSDPFQGPAYGMLDPDAEQNRLAAEAERTGEQNRPLGQNIAADARARNRAKALAEQTWARQMEVAASLPGLGSLGNRLALAGYGTQAAREVAGNLSPERLAEIRRSRTGTGMNKIAAAVSSRAGLLGAGYMGPRRAPAPAIRLPKLSAPIAKPAPIRATATPRPTPPPLAPVGRSTRQLEGTDIDRNQYDDQIRTPLLPDQDTQEEITRRRTAVGRGFTSGY